MFASIAHLLSPESYMPHGHCYFWEPGLLALQVGTNLAIGLAYLAISVTLAVMVRRGQYLPFKGMALAFGVFIVSCGITHFMDVYVIWTPAYWVDGMIRAVTAIASVGTALMLPPLVPRAVSLARSARAMRDRGIALESAVEELGRVVEKTRELEQLKTRFFANVSHELRTPLTLILGPAERLLDEPALSAHARGDVELILRNARTLLHHVNDLLDVARLESGRVETDYVAADLVGVCRLVAAHFDGIAAEREIELALDLPDALEVEIDRHRIERVLLNLLSNAFKFTPHGGTIRLTARVADDGALFVEVADSGPGIPQAQREAVFERFAQADGTSVEKFTGSGLGLSIVRDFVRLHGGSVEAGESELGGAAMRITMPRTAPAGTEVREASEDGPKNTDAVREALAELSERVAAFDRDEADARGGPTVLVVEDNADMNRFVCETLEVDGLQTVAVYDGAEALEHLELARPDLVVSDVMMPRMNGDELVRAMRENPALDAVPILLLTAKADDELRMRLLATGAQDYLMKPFAAAELRARVGNLLTMKRARDLLQSELASQSRNLAELAREITSRKRELQTALSAMDVAREHAERAAQLKSDFLALVSHELRTPLATLLLQLERLGLDRSGFELTEQQRNVIARMRRSTLRLKDLVESLLHYARVRHGRLLIRVEQVELEPLVQRLVEEHSQRAEAAALELAVHTELDAPTFPTDGRLLGLVASHLVANAIKFTERGRVDIELHRHQNGLVLHVRDTGPGIEPAARARIFEPFEHLEPPRHKHLPGVGLGLALVREMVAALGGRITLESRLGVGSTFTVELAPLEEEIE